MSDISQRRRFAARAITMCALAALPLTASISYAEVSDVPVPPAAPEPAAAPKSPQAPAAPDAPLAPVPPPAPGLPEDGSAPTPSDVHVFSRSEERGDVKRTVRVERKVVRDASGKPTERTSYMVDGREATAQERAEIAAELAKARKGIADAEQVHRELRVMRKRLSDDGEVRKEIEEIRRKLAEGGEFERELMLSLAQTRAEMPEFRFECDGSEQVVSERPGADGKPIMVICRTAALASARSAIGTARSAVESDRNLSRRERAEALRSLEEAMREIESVN